MQNRPLEWWEALLEEHIELDPNVRDKQVEFQTVQQAIARDIEGLPEADRNNAGLGKVHQRIHASTHKARALCFSGGGIRSATFNLGLLQGLAKKGWLDQFDYLSTVSGGGYVGSWLSAWVHRLGGIDKVQQELQRTTQARPASTRSMPADDSALTLEPDEVNYLREYSNYLTPRLGWFSGDTWVLVATYLRNLLLNWAVLIPIAVAVICFVWAAYFGFGALAAWLRAQPGLPPDQWRIWEQPWPTLASWVQLALLLFGIGAAIPLLPNFAAVRDSKEDKNRSPLEVAAHRRAGRLRPIWFVIIPVLLSACLLPASSYAWGGANPKPIPLASLFPRILITWLILAAVVTVITAAVLKAQANRRMGKPSLGVIGWSKLYLLYLVACSVSSFAGFAVMVQLMPYRNDHAVMFFWLLPPVRMMQVYLFFTVIVGGLSEVTSPDLEESREWWSRLMGLLLLSAVAYLLVVGVLLVAPVYLFQRSVGGGYGTTTLSASLLAGIGAVVAGNSAFTGAISTVAKSKSQRLLQLLPSALAAIFLLSAAFIAARLALWTMAAVGYDQSPWKSHASSFPERIDLLHCSYNFCLAMLVGIPALIMGLLLAWPINVNRFSLHNVYRMRLVRAYLGASRGNDREAEAFTGFDGKDNLPMHFLRRPKEFSEADLFGVDSSIASLHELCRFLVEWDHPVAKHIRKIQGPDNPMNDSAGFTKLEAFLKNPSDPSNTEDEIRTIIIKSFNAVLGDATLIEAAGGGLPPTVLQAAEQRLSDGQPYLANRLVLEHAVRQFCGKPIRGASVNKPFHVINAALNLVAGKKLAWQERKARSFTFTPLRCGFDYGYRPTALYADGVSLGGALTISGAAASPNMGYHSSPMVTALMTLFNVRLGAWLGNPALPTEQDRLTAAESFAQNAAHRFLVNPIKNRPAYRLASPRFSFQPLIDEFFGRTTEDSEHVYLSDGGHFENLGLYEMVRRRCSVIVISDASCDPDTRLADLGNAIRKIRIDLGIRVEMRRVNLKAATDDGQSVDYCTVGRIHYDDVDGPAALDGKFIYIKPTLKGREPVDIYNFSRENNKFPHETTADQWFAEAQFESYRRLGELAADDLFETFKTIPQPELEKTIAALDAMLEKRRQEQQKAASDRAHRKSDAAEHPNGQGAGVNGDKDADEPAAQI